MLEENIHKFNLGLIPATPAITSLRLVFDEAYFRDGEAWLVPQIGEGNQVPPAAWILQPLLARLPSVEKFEYEMFNFTGTAQFRDKLFTGT